MRSGSANSNREYREDLSTRARVRDSAIDLFARHGFRTSVRAIAEAADVSPGLILHHFDSKEGLRRSCDDHVLRTIRALKEKSVLRGSAQQMLMDMAAVDDRAPLVGYALRSLQSGGDLARSFIDHFVADAEEWIAEGVAAGTIIPSRNEKARARFLTIQGFGALMLDLTLNPPKDSSDFAGMIKGYIDRMGLPTAELYTEGLMTDRSMLDAYLMYVTDPPGDQAS
ncbi:TetR family transcriptional regulator [Arthrobacter pigmenti]